MMLWFGKPKYLDLLDQQVQAEVNFNEKINLLKRALIRSSLAAEGNDQQLDQQLQILRTLLREDLSNTQLEEHINQLDKAVLQAETNIQQREAMLDSSLMQLTRQLQQLQLDKGLQKELRRFEKSLPKQLAHPHNLQSLLMQLTELQGRILQSCSTLDPTAQHPSAGLFSRLFRSAEPAGSAPPSDSTETETVLAATEGEGQKYLQTPDPEPTQDEAQLEVADSASTAQSYPINTTDDSYALPELRNSNYSSVAKHIHQALTSLLNDLPVSHDYLQQILELRSRINQGLNWYELAPLLEDLSRIVLSVTNGAGLEPYLLELEQRSKSAHKSLQATTNSYTQLADDIQSLDNELRQQINQLRNALHSSTELTELQALVTTHLDNSVHSLQSHQESRSQIDSAVFACFQSLKDHSKQMGQAAQRLSEKPKEHRQKALLDSLTGLANRAAWNERIELEYARIQRNHSSLLIGIVEIDRFQEIKDSYGHLAGDKVLRLIAHIMKSRLRKTDFIARSFGSEQFSILLPETTLENGVQLLNELRLTIVDCPFRFKEQPVTITFSASVGQVSRKESIYQAFERIEQHLLAAKDTKHNQVLTAQ